MPAYVAADNVVQDREMLDRYRTMVGPKVLAYGGRYLTRGGPAEVVEGDWKPTGLVVFEIESRQQAKE